jgi:hypothetical protein
LPKVTAVRDVDKKPVEEVVKHWAEKNPQVCLTYTSCSGLITIN